MRQRCEANMPWFSVKWLTSALFLPALRHSDDQEIVDCGWRQVGVWECDRMLIEISYTLFICKKEIFYSEGRMQGREHLLKMHKTLHTHFVSYNLHILGWDPPFVFRTVLMLYGIDSTRCWNHSQVIVPHWHDSLTHLLQICWLHIRDVKVLCWNKDNSSPWELPSCSF